MSAEALVESLITEQSARTQDALDAAIEFGEDAQTAAISITSISPPPSVVAPDVDIPVPPDTDEGIIWTSNFGGSQAANQAAFVAAWNAFLDQFFPETDACIRLLADAWICNTIQNGGTGIPAAIENQIWDRARDRENEQTFEAAEQAIDEWAGRGFSLPPGALTGRVAEIQRKASDKLATINRDIAIKNIEIEIQNIRFAIEQANNLRISAINAAVAYIRAYFLPTELAIAEANGISNAKISFMSGASAYYGAMVAAARMQLDASITNAHTGAATNNAFVQLVNGNTASRVNAAVGSAASLGRAAAAGLGSINTLSNLGHLTTVEA